jgi:hypothetical protein
MMNGLLAVFAALIRATMTEMSGVGEGVGVGISGVGDGVGVAATPQLASTSNVSIRNGIKGRPAHKVLRH